MNRSIFGGLAAALLLVQGQSAQAIDLGGAFGVADAQTSNESHSDYFADADSDDKPTGDEVIHERYPNRAVKVERHVIQDNAGNYLNHGPWTYWDEKGSLIAQGQFNHGSRDGKWMRWYGPKEATLFGDSAAGGFQRPLGSEVTFRNGQMDGIWKVFDAKKRTVCEWSFENGRRIGRSVWYLPNGAVWQEVNFKDGQMDGQLLKLGPDNKLVVKERYIDGRRHAIETTNHKSGKKQSEGWMLYPRTYEDATYDWWTGVAQVVPVPKDRKAQRHGHWTRWHPNGQLEFDGAYEHDVPVGNVSWWHSNGQMKLRGQYANGSQDGTFTWWYPTGQKQVEGEFNVGVPTGKWMRWTAEGKVVQAEDYQHESHAVVEPEQMDEDVRVGEMPNSRSDSTRQ